MDQLLFVIQVHAIRVARFTRAECEPGSKAMPQLAITWNEREQTSLRTLLNLIDKSESESSIVINNVTRVALPLCVVFHRHFLVFLRHQNRQVLDTSRIGSERNRDGEGDAREGDTNPDEQITTKDKML